jgi:hypothetical protein
LKVYDVFGKQLLEQQVSGKVVEVNLTNALKGIYMVWVKAANGSTFTTRIVIE